jgi:hypothetical protein
MRLSRSPVCKCSLPSIAQRAYPNLRHHVAPDVEDSHA